MVNDFGTNNTVAASSPPAAMVVGALVWCSGHRWGAGLAGGAGASLAGWVALVLGLAEWRLDRGRRGRLRPSPAPLGYWIARRRRSARRIVVLLASVARSGGTGAPGSTPGSPRSAAISFIIAAGGPLIPQDTRRLDRQLELGVARRSSCRPPSSSAAPCSSVCSPCAASSAACSCAAGASAWPSAAPCRGLAARHGGHRADRRARSARATPIPAAQDLEPHAVTIVGFALLGFFCLVAVVMALLDADR